MLAVCCNIHHGNQFMHTESISYQQFGRQIWFNLTQFFLRKVYSWGDYKSLLKPIFLLALSWFSAPLPILWLQWYSFLEIPQRKFLSHWVASRQNYEINYLLELLQQLFFRQMIILWEVYSRLYCQVRCIKKKKSSYMVCKTRWIICSRHICSFPVRWQFRKRGKSVICML